MDDIIQSGKRGAQQFISAVQKSSVELAESTQKLSTAKAAKKKKKKKGSMPQTVGSSISHNSMVIQRSAVSMHKKASDETTDV